MSGTPTGGRPVVDVGVVTWNSRDLTVDALRRLLDTDQGCQIRLLVRDNGSTDGTAAAIAAVVPEAQLDAGNANLGFAGGVNSLLARSRAEWFLALNSDAWPEPGAIGRLVETALAHPRAAAIAARLERPDGTLEHSTHPFPSPAVAALVLTRAYRRLPGLARRHCIEGAWSHDQSRQVDWAVGAALLLRRQAVAEVGLLDERFFMYAEDIEWCWRAHSRGWEIWFEPSAVVRHVGNASGAQSYGSSRTAAYLCNTYRFYRGAHGPLSTGGYRALNAAGALRNYAASLWHRDAGEAARWRAQVGVHLTPVPAVDRPPDARRAA